MSLTLLIPMATTLRLQVIIEIKTLFFCAKQERSLLIQIIILCKQKLSMRNYTQANKSSMRTPSLYCLGTKRRKEEIHGLSSTALLQLYKIEEPEEFAKII